jgi:hypothetical protein
LEAAIVETVSGGVAGTQEAAARTWVAFADSMGGLDGGWSRSPSRGLSEADFKESIAAMAASSSATSGSSVFSSERTRTMFRCFRGGDTVGDTTVAAEQEDSDTKLRDG